MTRPFHIPAPGASRGLEENAAVIRIIAGDSLAGGAPGTADQLVSALRETSVRDGVAAGTPIVATDAYFWNKVFRLISGTYSKAYRSTVTSESDNAWEALHERTGFNAGTLTSNLNSALSLGLPWVFHYLANSLPIYYSNEARLPIHYIHYGVPSSFAGAFAANHPASWSPTYNDGAFEVLAGHYIAPAVNALRAAGKVVYIESMFFTAGGGDTGTDASLSLTGVPAATAIGQSLDVFLAALGLRTGGRIPTILIRPYATGSALFPDHADGKTSFDAQFAAFTTPDTDYIRMEGVPRAEAWPGIHPTSDGLVMVAQRYAEALGRLAARGARLVRVSGDLA